MSDVVQSPSARTVRVAALLGALGIILGAFGAHGLRDRLSPEMLAVFEVGVRYHMYHALALLAVGLAPEAWWKRIRMNWACRFWIAGVAIFSGSLYILSMSGIRWFGAITPIGGVALILGWVALALPQREA